MFSPTVFLNVQCIQSFMSCLSFLASTEDAIENVLFIQLSSFIITTKQTML